MRLVYRQVTGIWFRPTMPYALAATRIAAAFAACYFFATRRGAIPTGLSPRLRMPLRPETAWEPRSLLGVLHAPVPSNTMLDVLAWATIAALALLLVGAGGRVVGAIAAVLFLWCALIANSWGKIDHSFQTVSLALLILAFARATDVWSVDSLVRRWRRSGERRAPDASWHYTWPVRLVQFEYALMFFFAAYNKVWASGASWVFSANLRNTMVVQNALSNDWSGASIVVRHAVYHPWMWKSMALGALATEALFVLLVFTDNPWLRRLGLLMGISLVAGLDVVMRLPNWALFILLAAFVDWNGIRARVVAFRERDARTGASAPVPEAGTVGS